MARFKRQKSKNFKPFKEQAIYLVDLMNRMRAGQVRLSQEYVDVRNVIYNLSFVAKKYKEAKKVESLKDYYYRQKKLGELRSGRHGTILSTLQMGPAIRDLVTLDVLLFLQNASKDLTNHCTKVFRRTGAETARRFSSTFRALELQIKNLNTILGGVMEFFYTDERGFITGWHHKRVYTENQKKWQEKGHLLDWYKEKMSDIRLEEWFLKRGGMELPTEDKIEYAKLKEEYDKVWNFIYGWNQVGRFKRQEQRRIKLGKIKIK